MIRRADGELIEFAQEQRDHERGLQRSNAGARFVDADKTGADLDDIPQLHGRNPDRVEDFHVDEGVDAHEALDDELLEVGRPRHGDEKKQDGKGEVPHPAHSARQINSARGDDSGGERHGPTEQPPIGVRFLNEADRDQERGGQNDEQSGEDPVVRRRGRRARSAQRRQKM